MSATPTHSYTYKATHVVDLGDDIRSCGARERFMKETWTVKRGKYAWVNNDRFTVEREGDRITILSHRANLEAHMSMDFIYSENSAVVSIGGIDAKRLPCLDMVHLKRVK